MTDGTGLPEYERPPVVEVALTVQLKESVPIDVDALAAGWPECELSMRPLLPQMGTRPGVFERPDDESEDGRLWLAAPDGNRVTQIQHDRLAVHWTKGQPDENYPRFSSLRAALVDAWEKLDSVLDDTPIPDICQVLYINHVGAESEWEGPEDTRDILTSWRGETSDDFLPAPVVSAAYLHFHMPEPGKWLDVETGPIRDDNDEPVLAIYLGARGQASSEQLEGALEFMDLAHEWIVRGFTSLTTQKAHDIWRRKQR